MKKEMENSTMKKTKSTTKKTPEYKRCFVSRYNKRFKVHCDCTSVYERSTCTFFPEKPGEFAYFMEGRYDDRCLICGMNYRFYPKGLGDAKKKPKTTVELGKKV